MKNFNTFLNNVPDMEDNVPSSYKGSEVSPYFDHFNNPVDLT